MTHYKLADVVDYGKCVPGDTIEVMIEGKIYESFVDDHRVQRFKRNSVLDYMSVHDTNGNPIGPFGPNMHTMMRNLNTLAVAFSMGQFGKRDYMEIVMPGYSISGFCDLHTFADWHIQNPAWGDTKPARIWSEETSETK